MSDYRPSGFSLLPTVVKNLLIINGLCFLANMVAEARFHISLNSLFGLYNIESSSFKPYQLITHLFMHGGWQHILLNMFSLWMFGATLENYWGPKRFLIYYAVTGIGAALILSLINYFDYLSVVNHLTPESVELIKHQGKDLFLREMNYSDPDAGKLNLLLNVPTVGASGAVFGLLLAFGMLFPNSVIYLYFALPIKAKYFVILYGGLELYEGLANNPGDNVAHFAHLGGMLFGFILIKYWNKNKRNTFY